jgi:hypothetical protein
MQDDVDALDGVDIDSDVDMERDSADGEDAEEEDEKEEVVVDEDEEEDENNGKEPRMIGQGEMVNSSADDVDTMVDDDPTVLHKQNQEMCLHTPRPQPLAPGPWPQTPEPPPRSRTLETHTLSGLEFLGLVTPQKPLPAAPTLRDAEADGSTLDVDVEQQQLGESAGGDGLPNGPLPDVPLPDVPLRDAPVPEAHPDRSVDAE